MPIELTSEQEHRLIAILESGVYPTLEEALDAAITHLESAVDHDFEGSIDELNQLLLEGLNSGPSVEVNDDFWREIRASASDALALKNQNK